MKFYKGIRWSFEISEKNMIEKKILCIDQSPESIELVRRILEHGGIQYKFLAAIEAREGMKIALREIPDLILLDMHFPAGKTWNMIEQIRTNDNLKGIPIIGFSTMDYEGELQKNISSRSQPDMFLQKPLDMDKLLGAVKQLLKLIDKNWKPFAQKKNTHIEVRNGCFLWY